MSDSKNKRYRIRPTFVMTRMAEEAVIAPICDSTVEMGKLLSLNRTGADIMDGLREGLDTDDIVRHILDTYDDSDAPSVEKDVEDFIREMERRGYVEEVSGDDTPPAPTTGEPEP